MHAARAAASSVGGGSEGGAYRTAKKPRPGPYPATNASLAPTDGAGQSFPPRGSSDGRSSGRVCTVCLERSDKHKGPMQYCNAEKIHSGRAVFTQRSGKNALHLHGDKTHRICLYYNTYGCDKTSDPQHKQSFSHVCSGCGANHSAQDCHLRAI